MNAVSHEETDNPHQPGGLPAQFNPGVAHPARVYAYWLGGYFP